MNKSDLNELLRPFLEPEGVGATAYFLMQKQRELIAKRADIDHPIQSAIKDQFAETLKIQIEDDDERIVLDLSSADDRANAIYHYDLEEIPSGLELIDRIIIDDDLDDFSFSEDELSSVKAIIILIGNDEHQLAIYKRNYPVNILQRDSTLSIIKSETRFTKLDSDILKINDKIDFFKIKDELFILNLITLEKFFGFHDIIERKAREGLVAIKASGILDNPEDLEELLSDVSFARKMVKVTTDSPVLGEDIPNGVIIEFTKTHPVLSGKFKYNENESKIRLHTKQSKKLFLKLLNDDYLISELTRRRYDSTAKDKV